MNDERGTPREAAQRAIELMDSGDALLQPSVAIGPRPTASFASVLVALGDPPSIKVRCSCGYQLSKWSLDTSRTAVIPVHRVTPQHTGNALPWQDRANARKGRITTESGGMDGNMTHRYHCPRCKRDLPVSAERRFRLYLEAIRDRRSQATI